MPGFVIGPAITHSVTYNIYKEKIAAGFELNQYSNVSLCVVFKHKIKTFNSVSCYE